MIAIVNIDGSLPGEYRYEVRINRKYITTFEHNRPDGLAVCLKKASEAVKQAESEKVIESLDREGEQDGFA